MSGSTFAESLDEGRVGELYAEKHLPELITLPVKRVEDKHNDHIEGQDFIAHIPIESRSIDCEVKTIRNFLWRTNDNQEEHGTIGFELWSNKYRNERGWFLKMLHADQYSNVVIPDVLMFLLVSYEDVFACITFEDTASLFCRLQDIAKQQSIVLDSIPCGKKAKEWISGNALIIENMWMIPIDMIEDLATVTIIGNKPRIRPDIISGEDESRKCSSETQESRYQHLLELSSERTTVDVDDEYCCRFIGDKGDQVIATVDYNLSVLEILDFSQYSQLDYFRQHGKLFECLVPLLCCMLSIERPSKKMHNTTYYPMSYGHLKRWFDKNESGVALQTLAGHTKYMQALGFIGYSRPPKSSTNPIDIMVNKNNHNCKSVGYYTTVRFTEKVLLDADFEAQKYVIDRHTSSSVVKADFEDYEGSDKANKMYGNDGRTKTKAEEYVTSLFMDTIDNELEAHYYVTVENLCKKIWSKLVRQKKISFNQYQLTETERISEPDKKNPYYKAFKKCRKGIKLLAEKTSPLYVAHLISKRDRRWLEAKIPDGTYIITFKNCPDYYMNKYLQAKQREEQTENAKRRAKRKAKKMEK